MILLHYILPRMNYSTIGQMGQYLIYYSSILTNLFLL